jgi:hypothetical protein
MYYIIWARSSSKICVNISEQNLIKSSSSTALARGLNENINAISTSFTNHYIKYGTIEILWLINYCLTSSKQYFSYIQDENKLKTPR